MSGQGERTFCDGDIFDLLQELGTYLEGHLGQLDVVSKSFIPINNISKFIRISARNCKQSNLQFGRT